MSVTVFSSVRGDVQIPGPSTISAADPSVSNDGTQGFVAGSTWVNTANSRVWTCLSNATGAAAWALAVVPGVGIEPSNTLTQFGSGTGIFYEEGNLVRQTSGAGLSPGATGADNVIAAYSIPANSFDIAGRGLNILAQGSFANNTNVKRTKIIFNPSTAVVGSTIGTGGVTIADSGNYSTAGAVGWALVANVFKYGATGSNTQLGLHAGAQVGSVVGSLLVPSNMTAVESGVILVAVTGNATTTASDILLNLLEINCMN